MTKIIGIGGGTGLPVLLRGLRQLSESGGQQIASTAVVCVSDNGGSSGSLRESFGIPAVGDLRNCLVAMSGGDHPLCQLFQHRFQCGDGLHGHPVGNLIVTALCERTGNFGEAIRQVSEMLQVRGRVFPATEHPGTLCAQFDDGSTIRGEVEIVRHRRQVERVWLEPAEPAPARGLLAAIAAADMIVFGPGSLFTSVIPNLLTRGVAHAVAQSPALKVMVCNLMTQPGETDRFTAADHLRILEDYLGSHVIHACVLNGEPIREDLLTSHQANGMQPVVADVDAIAARGVIPIVADLLLHDSDKIRHDSMKLAQVIASLSRKADSLREWLPKAQVADESLCAVAAF